MCPAHLTDHGYSLVAPRIVKPRIPAGIMTKIAGALVTRFSPLDVKQEDLIPIQRIKELLVQSEIESWGRLRRLEGGDTMLASETVKLESEDRRDATFVKVSPRMSDLRVLLAHPTSNNTVPALGRRKREVAQEGQQIQADDNLRQARIRLPPEATSCTRSWAQASKGGRSRGDRRVRFAVASPFPYRHVHLLATQVQ